MENILESCVPPGFRFHPTEEELVGYYLKRKVNSLNIDLDVIVDIDFYRMEPWDIQDRCKLGYEEQNDWYFFSHKDRKYPIGARTNRAIVAGFWKATGRDKAVLSKDKIIGMRKTLVFYKGRAPNRAKTDWIMHEYRLHNLPTQEEGWVVCRAFKKLIPIHKHGSTTSLDHLHHHLQVQSDRSSHIFELPKLDSPLIPTIFTTNHNNLEEAEDEMRNLGYYQRHSVWKNLDKLLDSQETEPPSFVYTNMHVL